jgi:integrase
MASEPTTPTIRKLLPISNAEKGGGVRTMSAGAELLTDKIVRNLPPPARGAPITYDGGDPKKRVSGFGVRITTGGVRSFILNYRAGGVERRCTIGKFPDWNVGEARARAKQLKREIDQGKDPLLEEREHREAPTINDLIERWRRDMKPTKRERSGREDESLIEQWIKPRLGTGKVAEITESHIDRLHRKITEHGTPVRANRTIAFLKHLLNLAIRWKMRGDNPAAAVEWNHEDPKTRFLSNAELGRLTAALAADRNRIAANAIRLFVLTGARPCEVYSATWPQFDIEKGRWTKPSSHTKQKRPHYVPLSPAAIELLIGMKEEAERRPRQQQCLPSPYLFPADLERRYSARKRAKIDRGDGPIVSVRSTWERVCKAAKLDDVRPYDLRHTYASLAADSGASLPMIGALLGHTQAQTTMRYVHLAADGQSRAITDQVGARVTAAGRPGGEVIPLPQRKG